MSDEPSIGKKTVRDIDVAGMRVLLRADLNVPVDDGRVADDSRIRASLPTIRYLLDQRARVVVCSHLGRPGGKPDRALSLEPVAARLGELLGTDVRFVNDCVGPEVEAAVAGLGEGEILMLDNLRFHAEEEDNDREFARRLAAPAQIFVNDAFGAAHRAHASTAGVAEFLPAVAGLLMERELRYLGALVQDPPRPFAAIVGGAKVSTKTAAVENLLPRLDILAVGGGMANTFLAALNVEVGRSLLERDQVPLAKSIMERAGESGLEVVLPIDAVVATSLESNDPPETIDIGEVPPDKMILDAGPRTIELFRVKLKNARAIVWNGPLGVFEDERFAEGSFALARLLAESRATTVVGGGETAAVVARSGLEEAFDHVSTGGGASLELLEGRELPGVAALQDEK